MSTPMDQIDEMQSREDAAEAMMDRMTAGLPAGMFRCDCGRAASLAAAVSATPSPYSPPICPLCAEGTPMDEMKHTAEPWKRIPDNSHPVAINGVVFGGGEGSPAGADADARRIVACVNACEGLRTESLEHVYGAAVQWHESMKNEISIFHALKEQRDKARELLNKALPLLRGWIKDAGGCDHSVGICMCHDIRVADEIEAALTEVKHEQR